MNLKLFTPSFWAPLLFIGLVRLVIWGTICTSIFCRSFRSLCLRFNFATRMRDHRFIRVLRRSGQVVCPWRTLVDDRLESPIEYMLVSHADEELFSSAHGTLVAWQFERPVGIGQWERTYFINAERYFLTFSWPGAGFLDRVRPWTVRGPRILSFLFTATQEIRSLCLNNPYLSTELQLEDVLTRNAP